MTYEVMRYDVNISTGKTKSEEYKGNGHIRR
jgi:hypothetical protein